MLQQPGLLGHLSWVCPNLNEIRNLEELKNALLSARNTFSTPPILLGYSMGGRLALLMATKMPSLWAGLILIGSSAGINDPHERAARLEQDHQLAEFIRDHGVPAFIQKWQQHPVIRSQENIAPNFRQAMLARRLQRNPETLRSHLTTFSPGKLPWTGSAWKEFPLPVLLCVGEFDEKFRRINENLLNARSERTTLAIIPGVGHAAHLENPDAFSEAAQSFIQTLVTSDPRQP